jgi:molecular chaperone DnaJ
VDLYGALDLAPTASAADIERAYLRLARRYHPRINPGDRHAEERYRQVQSAYEVLGHPERRQDYDAGRLAPAGGAPTIDATIAFEGFDFASVAQGQDAATFSELFADVFQDAARRALSPEAGSPIELTLPLSFLDAMRGGTCPVSIVRQERCHSCEGHGRVAVPPRPCPLCQGQGATRWARGHMVFTKPCDGCDATGRLTSVPCRPCAASGLHSRSELVTIVVPPGVEDGARLAIPGRGHAGARGGPAGDLYVTAQVAPHPVFRREGRDLCFTLPVAVHEAALGAQVEVPTLAEPVTVRIPPGTGSGARLRLRGHGVPGPSVDLSGDLIAELQIVLPPVRDERSRALLREFGERNPVDVRAGLFSS